MTTAETVKPPAEAGGDLRADFDPANIPGLTADLPEETSTKTGKTGTIVPHKKRETARWFPEGFYSLHGDNAMLEFAAAQPLPTPMKLYFLCSARANRWGHAAFEPGELGKLLNCSPPTRRAAVSSLKSAQMIAPDSTPLCVVLTGA